MPFNPPIRDWKGKRCWIIGASTGIGAALSEMLAAKGARVALSARRQEPLEALAAKGGECLVLPLDINDAPALSQALETIVAKWGGLDLVVFMAGDYQPMRAWELDLEVARRMIQTNLLGFLNGLAPVIPLFLKQKAGTIALVSSVAGYRGLPKSLIYGPTKAAIINLAETMYLDLQPSGVGVCVVNPGFVKTPLTAGNEFDMPALISPEEAAQGIVDGLGRGEFEIHFPKRFTRVMRLLRLLPYRLYFPAIRKFTGL
jgi:NAD(P)-dependent dehydrogenase (short-subunit alcohol dehydrogenase family)